MANEKTISITQLRKEAPLIHNFKFFTSILKGEGIIKTYQKRKEFILMKKDAKLKSQLISRKKKAARQTPEDALNYSLNSLIDAFAPLKELQKMIELRRRNLVMNGKVEAIRESMKILCLLSPEMGKLNISGSLSVDEKRGGNARFIRRRHANWQRQYRIPKGPAYFQ